MISCRSFCWICLVIRTRARKLLGTCRLNRVPSRLVVSGIKSANMGLNRYRIVSKGSSTRMKGVMTWALSWREARRALAHSVH
ncbi:hypothetical protein Peur_000640 [Populus x canadensis]